VLFESPVDVKVIVIGIWNTQASLPLNFPFDIRIGIFVATELIIYL
jgi:hypothetical protein